MSKKISIQKPIIVAISGTPGTGKTSIAKELSLSKRWKLIEISKFAKNVNPTTTAANHPISLSMAHLNF